VEVLEAQHRLDDAFDGSMVLLDHVIEVLDLTNLRGVSRVAFTACNAARFEPLLSMVTSRVYRSERSTFSKKRRAAILSRLALNRKSMV
jgi:hypothetical protein